MAGLQTILDYCNGIEIDRRKTVGIQMTRNEIPRVSQTPTKNPWRFTIDMPSSFQYNDARALMEQIDTLDRITPQIVTFSNNPKLSWIYRYQGSMTLIQITNLTVQSFIGDQLVLTGLPTANQGAIMFAQNDLIQINGHPYPFTSTTVVTRGIGSTLTITTNRPNIITGTVVGSGVTVGNDCSWNMFCPNMPTYKLIVGAPQYYGNTLVGNAMLSWQDSFKFFEFVGAA